MDCKSKFGFIVGLLAVSLLFVAPQRANSADVIDLLEMLGSWGFATLETEDNGRGTALLFGPVNRRATSDTIDPGTAASEISVEVSFLGGLSESVTTVNYSLLGIFSSFESTPIENGATAVIDLEDRNAARVVLRVKVIPRKSADINEITDAVFLVFQGSDFYLVYEKDGGGVECTVDADCDDGNPTNGIETCVAGLCQAGTPPAETECADGIDNDSDGSTDCADSDCLGDIACGGR